MYIEGIKCRTFGWLLGRLKITEEINKEYGTDIVFKPDNLWWAILAFKAKIILRYKWMLKLLKHFIVLPSVLFEYSYVREIDGHKFLIDNKDYRMSEILKDYTLLDIWEPETTEIVKREVKEGQVCVDIGASVGYFTLLFARQVGEKGKVISIEPTEMGFNYQQENIKLNGYTNIYPYKVAAWDKEEVISIPKSSPYPIWANAMPVDELLKGLGVERIDFIKIDVDGPEPKVLKGLVKTFEANPKMKMVIEWYKKYIEGADCNPDEFWEIINKYFKWSKIEGDYTEDYFNIYCERK